LGSVTINNRAAVVGVAVAAAIGLAGCGATATSAGAQPPAAGVGVLVGRVTPLNPGAVTAEEIGADETAFGFALFDKLCAAAPTSNLTLSPASAAEALGMLDAGSVGATRRAIGRLLHLPGWSPALVAALNAQTAALGQVSQVTVTNHVFEQSGSSPTQQALNDLRTAYNADLRQVNFANEPDATNSINSVISHDTDKLIPALFGQPLDPDTQTVLANAILLNAKWREPFPSATPGTFHTAAGQPVSASLMDNAMAEFASRTVDGWTSVVMPYVGSLQAVALLPPASAAGSEQCATPSTATLASLTSGPSQPAGVVLPKLNLSQTLALTRQLAAMGLPLRGSYSGLGATDAQISEVVQKVVMKVDQKGTKAAAATGIAMTSAARVPSQVVSFNRPFLLLLEDTKTHTPLFLTRVANPTQS
jgi:serpin B